MFIIINLALSLSGHEFFSFMFPDTKFIESTSGQISTLDCVIIFIYV